MSQTARTFRLADEIGAGLSCDETGLFLGDTPLLARDAGQGWRPRPLDELNAASAASYGLPVDFAAKLAGLGVVAAALDRGEIALAKIAALQLRLPDPPPLAKGPLGADALARLASDLQASGVLAKDFDPDKHPRWPGGGPDSQGGRFAPAGAGGAPEAAAPTAAPKKPKGRQEKPDPPSPLATSLQRQPQQLSRRDKALLDTLEAKLKDPTNQGIVTFSNRDDALKDMGYFFSADITKFDDPEHQVERAAWLIYDPNKGEWSYDRSQMVVGTSGKVRLAFGQAAGPYLSGDAIYVHIHPIEYNHALGASDPEGDNDHNRTFSYPEPNHGEVADNDAATLSAASTAGGKPLHAAVIGSDGSISYSDGGFKPRDYEGKSASVIARRGTVPMRDPN